MKYFLTTIQVIQALTCISSTGKAEKGRSGIKELKATLSYMTCSKPVWELHEGLSQDTQNQKTNKK